MSVTVAGAADGSNKKRKRTLVPVNCRNGLSGGRTPSDSSWAV
jgi:hypothetical protein